MNKGIEKNKLIKAHKMYSSRVRQLWNELLKKYNFDEETAISIISDLWYEPSNAEEFENEWIEGTDKIRNEIERRFEVFIEHEEELITVRNGNFIYDGNLIIEEEKY